MHRNPFFTFLPFLSIFFGFGIIFSSGFIDAQTGASGIYSTSTTSNVDPLNTGQYWVRYDAIDNAGNASSATTTVSVRDTTPPNATWTATMTVERTDSSSWPSCGGFGGPCTNWDSFVRSFITASDQYDSAHGMSNATITIFFSPTPIGNYPNQKATITVYYVLSDSHGNKATKTAAVIVGDTIPPTIASTTYTSERETNVTYLNYWTNNNVVVKISASEPVTVSSVQDPSGACSPNTWTNVGTNQWSLTCQANATLTISATDISGNSTRTTAYINKIDKTPPVLSAATASVTLEANYGSYFSVPENAVTCSDNYSSDGFNSGCAEKTHNITSTSLSATGTTLVTWNATDTARNTAIPVSVSYVVVDTTKPIITVNPDIILISAASSSNKYSGGTDPRLIWGNGDTTSGAVNVTDNLDQFNNPLNASNSGEFVTYSWSIPFNESVHGDYYITYTVTDKSGNSNTAQRKVEVRTSADAPNAVITYEPYLSPTNNTVLATVNFTKPVTDIIVASGTNITNNADGWFCNGGVGIYKTYCYKYYASNTSPIGDILTFVDQSGQSNSSTVRVLVDWIDTVQPSIYLSSNTLFHEAATPLTIPTINGASFGGITATAYDNPDVNYNSTYVGLASTSYISTAPTEVASLTAPATYTVTYFVTDNAINSTSSVLSVVIRDNTPPVFSPNPIPTTTIERLTSVNFDDTYLKSGVTAIDTNDGSKTSSISVNRITNASGTVITSIPSTTDAGTYEVTLTVADTAGNVATTTRVFQIIDTTAPALVSKEYSNGNNAETTWVNTNVTATITVSEPILTPAGWNRVNDITFYRVYEYNDTVVATLTDIDNNTIAISVSVGMIDKTPPDMALIGGGGTTNHQAGSYFYDQGFSAIDSQSGLISSSTISNNVDIYRPGTYTVVYEAVDVAGNRAEITRTVVVIDTTPPVITVAPTYYTIHRNDIKSDTNSMSQYLWNGISVTDNVYPTSSPATSSVTITASSTFASSSINATGTYVINYITHDASGNVAYATRHINVIDIDKPIASISYTATSTGGASRGAVVRDTTDYTAIPWTNDYVIVKLSLSEKISPISGFSCLDSATNTVCTKAVYGNELSSVSFTDLGGLVGTTTYTVAKIDKTPPYIQSGYSSTQTHEAPNATFATQTPYWIDRGDSTSSSTAPTSTPLYWSSSPYINNYSSYFYLTGYLNESVSWTVWTTSPYSSCYYGDQYSCYSDYYSNQITSGFSSYVSASIYASSSDQGIVAIASNGHSTTTFQQIIPASIQTPSSTLNWSSYPYISYGYVYGTLDRTSNWSVYVTDPYSSCYYGDRYSCSYGYSSSSLVAEGYSSYISAYIGGYASTSSSTLGVVLFATATDSGAATTTSLMYYP